MKNQEKDKLKREAEKAMRDFHNSGYGNNSEALKKINEYRKSIGLGEFDKPGLVYEPKG